MEFQQVIELVGEVVDVVGVAAIVIGAVQRRLPRYGLLAIGGYLVVAVLGRGLFPTVMQKFVVAPTELTRETPYLRHHIAATRRAWGERPLAVAPAWR